ncbi:hypothetical protein EDF67_10127 [Sphingobacterium sp. JUb78]|nr:hypothetical protein [Sphingobacterium kitahiroshimense]TCR13924.1 hypothetical protein EDF67_10127 [Sphingobacterium sp. JUb78]
MTSLDDNEDLIYNLMSIADLLSLRDLFWIDPRIS